VEDNSSESETTHTPASAEAGKLSEPLAPSVEAPPLAPAVTPTSGTPLNPVTKAVGSQLEEMGQTKIRSFRGLRDGKEDPTEHIEDIE
jgi:hypothetical protein